MIFNILAAFNLLTKTTYCQYPAQRPDSPNGPMESYNPIEQYDSMPPQKPINPMEKPEDMMDERQMRSGGRTRAVGEIGAGGRMGFKGQNEAGAQMSQIGPEDQNFEDGRRIDFTQFNIENNVEALLKMRANMRLRDSGLQRFIPHNNFIPLKSKVMDHGIKDKITNIFGRIKNFVVSRFISTTRSPRTPKTRGWKKGGWGSIPEGAFVGGIRSDGRKVYIARTMDDKDVVPGYLITGSICVRYASSWWWGRCGKNYEVLVGDSFTWVNAYNGSKFHEFSIIHPDAVEGGHIRTASGVQRLHICRAWYFQQMYIGRLLGTVDSQPFCLSSIRGFSRVQNAFETLLDPV